LARAGLAHAGDHRAAPDTRNATGLRFVQPQAVRKTDDAAGLGAELHAGAAYQLAIILLFFTTWATCPWVLPALACLTGFDTFAVFTWPWLRFLARAE
jgi:hypothetical protein